MDWEFKEIVEAHQLTKAGFEKEVLDGAKPVTLRGFASKWPLIKSQQTSPEALIGYLDTFYSQKPVVTWLAPREEQGRFFYNKDLSGFNFSRKQSHLTECLKAVMTPVTNYLRSLMTRKHRHPIEIICTNYAVDLKQHASGFNKNW